MFADKLGEDSFVLWMEESFHQQFTSFSVSNRYFTNAKQMTYLEKVPFTPEEDPFGTLKRLGSAELIHCEDNIVRYYKADGEGK